MKWVKNFVLIVIGVFLYLGTITPIKAAAFSMSASTNTVSPGGTFVVTLSGNVTGNVFINVENGTASESQIWIENNSISVTITAGSSGVVRVRATPGEGLSDPQGNAVADTSSASVSVTIQQPTSSNSSRPSTPSSSNSKPVKTFNLNLSSIQVDGAVLSPDFSGDTVDYSVEFPKGTTSVTINATAADSEVSIQGVGEHEVHEGNNVIELTTHHSETSTTKTYRIQVYVEEEPKVFLTYNNMELGVYPSFHGSEALEGFENTEVTIQDQQVLGKVNEQGLVLLYMVEESGEKAFYVYKDEVLYKYLPITIAGRTFISLEIPDDMKNMTGLIQQKITIDDVEYDGWVFEDETFSNYSLLYLMDEKGDIHLYQYESTEGVIQLYSGAAALKQESVDEMSNELNMMRIALIAVSVIAIIILGVGFYFYKKKLSLQH